MTIRAYQETFLNKVQADLGDAFDYAINTCGIEGDHFVKLFTASSVSKRIENGEAAIIAGKSGIEIAIDVILETTGRLLEYEPKEKFGRSAEYWIGWAVGYYQWYSSCSFKDIITAVPLSQIIEMYPVYHEMDIRRFTDYMDKRMREAYPTTRLKVHRLNNRLSQSELAAESGVALRQIQLFEQKQRDINNAAAITLLRLSKALHCRMEDLLQPSFHNDH